MSITDGYPLLLAEALDWPIDLSYDGLECGQRFRTPDRRCKAGYRLTPCYSRFWDFATPRELMEEIAGHICREHWKPGYPVVDPPGPPEH